jgi:FlaA1/EpsC-like NDP-sugar epimerase
MNELNLIGRTTPLFISDISDNEATIDQIIKRSSFLVIGGAGTIGQAVTREIFDRDPKRLHVVDISENSMVELVRDIRSSSGYGSGDFRTFSIDCGGIEFESLLEFEGPYDYVFNLSALKHVRSEKDPFTLMRMIYVNVFNTLKTLDLTTGRQLEKYFCVSTDKAANPVNMMGASKLIMEMYLNRASQQQNISTARFANVAFSDGSLLHGFNQRFLKRQPLSAPNDIKRYFVTPKESGQLCLMSGLFGQNRDIFFPKLSEKLHLISFADIAKKYINARGYDIFECESETEARKRADDLIPNKKWPCYFFDSDTTGEKNFEEFYTERETLEMSLYNDIGVIKNVLNFDNEKLNSFERDVERLRKNKIWNKEQLIELYFDLLPDFAHQETGKYLDNRM